MTRRNNCEVARGGALLILLLLLAACDAQAPTAIAEDAHAARISPASAVAFADAWDGRVAIDWFRVTFELTRDEGFSPPEAARAYAYTGVTLWESVAPGVRGGISLAGQLNGYAGVDVTVTEVHWPLVANTALASIARRLYTSRSSRARIAAVEGSLQNAFRKQINVERFGRSISYGKKVAAAIWQWSMNDGYAEWSDCDYEPPVGRAFWRPTPPNFEAPIQPCWGRLRPFILKSPGQCAPATHPPYSENPGSVFYQEAEEVHETVLNLTAEQLEIANYWADLPGQTGTPAGHSLSIATQALERVNARLDFAAEVLARVAIGESDAFIACWSTKYHYGLVRPVTYIHRMFDATWLPPIDTPPFPAYTSGHSNDAGAASTILTAMFGTSFRFTDHTHEARGFAPRSFRSFAEAAEESAISRLYGGIHYRSDITAGLEQGRCVGRAVNALVFRYL